MHACHMRGSSNRGPFSPLPRLAVARHVSVGPTGLVGEAGEAWRQPFEQWSGSTADEFMFALLNRRSST